MYLILIIYNIFITLNLSILFSGGVTAVRQRSKSFGGHANKSTEYDNYEPRSPQLRHGGSSSFDSDDAVPQRRHVSRPGTEIRINGVREASSKTRKF